MIRRGKRKLSIIIPAHNEEKRIKRTLVRYLNYFKDSGEILVVLDGCEDSTPEIVQEIRNKYPSLRYKNIPQSIGKGGALTEGFRIVNGEIIAYVDADGATGPEELDRLIDAMGHSDGVLGSRWIRNSVVLKEQPLIRRFASRAFNILVRTLFLFPYKDTQCGAKIFKKGVVKSIVEELGITNFAFDVDLLYLIHKKGFKIKEVPTVWADQDSSTLDLKKVAPTMLAAVIRLRLKHSILKSLVK